MLRQRATALLAGLLLLVCSGIAFADGIIVPGPPWPRPPYPPHPVPRPVPRISPLNIRYHHVKVEIDEGVAVTHIDQVFHNPNNFPLEGTYLFPIPEGASISKFSMDIDGKQVEGELLEKNKARKLYEDIVRRMRDPALLEYVNRRTFKARVHPIPANGEKRIKLEYSEFLPLDSGLRTYRYPLNTEKFSGKPLDDVSVVVRIRSKQPLKSIVSPSHKVDVARKSDHEATVSYEAVKTLPDKDFVLYTTVSEADFGVSLVTFREKDHKGYFMAMVSPGVEIDEEKVIVKDMVFVFDTSGSMVQDDKIGQARNALEFCLRSLNRDDRFNIIDFSTAARTFREEPVPASAANVAAGVKYAKGLKARGGTAIAEALATAVAMADGAERPFMVVFLTDGKPTIGAREPNDIIAEVKKAARGRLRLFTFGVGYDVNTLLLDRLASENRGTREYVVPGEDIEIKVSSFYRKIGSPVLSEVRLEFDGIKVEDVYPRPFDDLFRGSQLVAVGRYDGAGDHAIRLSGTVNGRKRTFTYEGRFAGEDTAHEFLPRHWATRKIGYLVDQIRLHGDSKELKSEIVRLSRKYGVMTPYTSFLVVEDDKHLERPTPAGAALRRAGRPQRLAMERAADALSMSAGKGAVQFSLRTRTLRKEGIAAPEAFLGAAQAREIVVRVGNRTYYQHDNVWIVSTYDETMHRRDLVRVRYLSDEYFELTRRLPALAGAFALGDRVIAEAGGRFYEVLPQE